MALLKDTFVTSETEDAGFEPLPVDWYTAQITKSDIKVTSKGDGEYISNQWKVLDAEDPKWVGRTFFQNLNIVNPSEVAVKIGKGQLKLITIAMGIEELTDTDELLGNPVKVFLAIKKGKNGYDDSNEIKKVKSLDADDEDDGGSSDGGPESWTD